MIAAGDTGLDCHPFDALKEIERRSLGADALDAAGTASTPALTGLAFRLGGTRIVVPMNAVDEILRVPHLTRVPGARPWVRGVANLRGMILTVIDLAAFFDLPTAKNGVDARVLVTNEGAVPSGLLVSELVGMRHFFADQAEPLDADHEGRLGRFLTGAYRADGAVWQIISVPRLLKDSRFAGATG